MKIKSADQNGNFNASESGLGAEVKRIRFQAQHRIRLALGSLIVSDL